MRKKLSALGLLFTVIIGLQLSNTGCCPDESICLTVDTTNLTILDNSHDIPKTPQNETVPAKALLLRLTLENKGSMCYKPPAFSLINSAYARSCRPKEKIQDSITDISITSNQPYNINHPAGAELNELFVKPSISEFNTTDDSTYFDMLAKTGSDNEGPHIFTVRLLFKSGASKSAVSEPIKLIP